MSSRTHAGEENEPLRRYSCTPHTLTPLLTVLAMSPCNASATSSWGREIPTPPSSGGSESVLLQDKQGAVRLRAEEKELKETLQPLMDHSQEGAHRTDFPHQKNEHQQVFCRRDSRVLTPPSTRGRRMCDVLCRSGAADKYHRQRIRHIRHLNDLSEPPAWMLDDLDLFSPSSPRDTLRNRGNVPTCAPLPSASRPIRDASHNPFIEGGPADVGLSGPHGRSTLKHASARPPKDPDSTIYVLYVIEFEELTLHFSRGQRVVYTDTNKCKHTTSPLHDDYASPPRPRLLFPMAHRQHAPYVIPERNASSEDDLSDPIGGLPSGGLFAEEILARAKDSSTEQHDHTLGDSDAKWFASNTHSRSRFVLPAKNRELLARLNHVSWVDHEE